MSNRTSSSKKKNQKGNSSVAQVRQAPLAKSYRIQTQPPRRSQNNGVTVIKGSLEFATVAGSTSFSATKHQMNPGFPVFTGLSTFPQQTLSLSL